MFPSAASAGDMDHEPGDHMTLSNPVTRFPGDGFRRQQQDQPGLTSRTDPQPDHGEDDYRGADRLRGMRALITGGDSGIGRAVAIAYAREGADVAISYLPDEQDDADDTVAWTRRAGRVGVQLPGDVRSEDQCAELVERTVTELGGLDILVLNAAYQRNRDGLENIPTAELERVFVTNLFAPLWIARAAITQLHAGASIITTSSIQAFQPSPKLIDYAMTKAARISNAVATHGAKAVGAKGGEAQDLEDRTVPQLRARAKELGISGYSGKRKAELIELIRHH